MDRYIEVLAKIEKLNDAQIQAVEQLRPYARKTILAPGQHLASFNDIFNISLFVEKGLLRMYVANDTGNEKIIQFLNEESFYDDCKSYFEKKPGETGRKLSLPYGFQS